VNGYWLFLIFLNQIEASVRQSGRLTPGPPESTNKKITNNHSQISNHAFGVQALAASGLAAASARTPKVLIPNRLGGLCDIVAFRKACYS
jgi:hypothetical protein